MTKYVIKDDDGNYKRICEDVESRDHWINTFAAHDHSNYQEISDEDYVLLQKSEKDFTEREPVTLPLVDKFENSILKEDVEENLKRLISELEGAIKTNANPPAIWTTNLNTLKAIDISALSFPMTGYSWVDCLIKNGIQVPSSMEF